MTTVQPFLMFSGQAEEAMRFYVDTFDQAEINELHKYGMGQSGKEGTVQQGVFSIHGQTILCMDSTLDQPFTFTPSFSLFITCDQESELNRVFDSLSEGGEILMPMDHYPFSKKFGWVNDRFGVSWQLSL
ncbi:putative 3-demethylubiquinone-9 3-methyltransferase (glyoxalase superfamily) [Natronobacillus azotifigens]|uniref:VOC family protein n=1 Tax=Natronobacillus azotifigens TaxID=472978 RepID=A0A9J6R7P0_9BACI|nr:VOC family protein [Natronobacillus azotifigens]MCZ0701648.1 VOC family protein [Natronobacillus azotifigens]